jgi:hypothetical protein
MSDRSFVASVVLALGTAIGGGLVGWGFARGRTADQYVEVKGLAEREATADEVVRVVSTVQYVLD